MMMSRFQVGYDGLVTQLCEKGIKVPSLYWQSQRTEGRPGMAFSQELRHVTFKYLIPSTMEALAEDMKPNMPWAEDHFQERVSGRPLNPPPSEAWWPYRVNQNAEHKEGEKFSHTYPERIWPVEAWLENGTETARYRMRGIRYQYGDLNDVVSLIARDPYTRQAYLPIWFPEDTGAASGQRVPCTLGYHFIFRPEGERLRGEIVYYIRSCDLFRHFTDDVYMACRLLQWVVGKLQGRGIDSFASSLVMHITSLHVFEGDMARLTAWSNQIKDAEEPTYGTSF